MGRIRAILFLAASFLFHVALFIWLRSLTNLQIKTSERVTVDLVATQAQISNNTILERVTAKNQKASPTKHLTLQDLGIAGLRHGAPVKNEILFDAPQGQNERPWTESASYVSNSLNAFDGMEMAQIRFTQAIWHEVDRYIFDSSFLSEYNHTRAIHLKFTIDENGHLDENSLRACGSDRVLKVIALRALRKAMRNDTAEIPSYHKRETYFAQFSWSDYESCKTLRGTRQNYLSFCHYAENKRKSFSKGEKVGTYLKSLNYGFGAIEELEKYNREKSRRNTQFEPFEEMRHDPDWDLGC